MAEDIRTMKSFMQGLNFYTGQEIAPLDDPSTIVSIPTTGNVSYTDRFKLAGNLSPHMNDWTFDSLVMTAGATNSDPGGVSFRCWNEQKIDLTGLLQLGAAYAPLGSASQRAGVPQLPGDWFSPVRANSNLTYMRDFTIWSVEPLTDQDLNNLWSDGITRQSITPNMPNFGALGGSMTTTQMLSSQTRLFVGDSGLSSRVGWMREIFAQMGGMGETAAAPHIYCTRVISGQMKTTPKTTITDAGTPDTTTDWVASKFWISFPPSWELLNVGMMTPDDLEYLTYMQRSVLAPGGRQT